MHWRKCDLWKAGIIIAGMALFLLLMTWLPLSAASAHEETLGVATPGTVMVQTTPTEDATVTALNKEKLVQEVQQLQHQVQNQNNWFFSNSAALIAAFSAIAIAVFGIIQWTGTARQAKDKDRQDRAEERRKEATAQEKDLRDRAEERFRVAVTGLGDEKEGARIGAAILLRTFLHPGYEQFYTPTFDLAVAHLRLPRTTHSSEDPTISQPLTTLSQALITVFKESFLLARDRLKEENSEFSPHLLDASCIQVDNAYLRGAHLEQAWMPLASLQDVDLGEAKLINANLRGTQLVRANLLEADLSDADLSGAHLSDADLRATTLCKTNFTYADLRGADLMGATLREAIFCDANLNCAALDELNLSGVDFRRSDLSEATFVGANLRGAKLDHADLKYSDFSNADLSGATLSESDLCHAGLCNTNLSTADLSGCRLDQANLMGADLTGAIIERIRSLEGAKLCKVTGLTEEQKAICKAKRAEVDEDPTTNVSPS